KSQKVIGQGHLEDGASHNGDALSSLFRLSLIKERPVKKVVLDETIGFFESNEHPELLKVRARGWYLLTRCTVHVCNSRDMFVDYQPVTGHEMVLENNSPVDVVGFGTVKLQLTSGKVLILENVFHMPKIARCCISVSKLTKMGFTVGFWNEGCDIKKDHETVGIRYVEDELYRLSVVDEHPSADSDSMIDHRFNLDNDDQADVAAIRVDYWKCFDFNNVFHMPAIVKCCLSMNKLMEMGLGVAFHGEGCYVKKCDQIVGNGFVEEGLFRMGIIGEHSGGNQA
nr:hypothetical protein CTI12_AA544960 [Tanacetum cinerariifolium]